MIRFFDFLLALFGLIVLLPVGLVLMVVGWFVTGKPLFFQKRVGWQQREFILVKFRTMRVGTVSVATHEVDHHAVMRWGAFLRKTKLDELPQLWNVLKGEMSLVGPRPCLPNQAELIAERELLGVFSVRPGITGLAQIQGIDMSDPVRLAFVDAEMVNRGISVVTYFQCVFATLKGKGQGDRVIKM